MTNLKTQAMVVLSLALVMTTAIAAGGQNPNSNGAFSIENQTGVTISYQVKWGESHPWKSIALASGRVETHSYPLENGKALTPYVRFDRIGGDGAFTPKEYRMGFYAVGPGARTNSGPKKYFFKFAADGRTLDILAR